MRRKWFSFFIVICMLFCMFPAGVLAEEESGGATLQEEIQYNDMTECTRGMICYILWKASGEPEPSNMDTPYSDVSMDSPFYKAILWAIEAELTRGVSVTEFCPDLTCTKGQVATFIYKAAGGFSAGNYTLDYTDVKEDAFYYEPVKFVTKYGLMKGISSTEFGPNQTCYMGSVNVDRLPDYLITSFKGSCGSNLNWTLDLETGELVIFGTGAMNDFDSESDIPWRKSRDKILSVSIKKGVTTIGKNAFYDCSSLKDVYYSGSEEDWNRITIKDGNYDLTSAEIHYNSAVDLEGWKKNSTGWWYQNADGTYPKNTWKIIDGKWYHFDSKGYMQTGWLEIGGTMYYLKSSGAMATSWLKIGSDWYYFNSNGSMATETWIGNFYLTSSGKMAKDTWIGDKYVDSSGKYDPTKVKITEGWKKNSTGWWYQNADGTYPKNTWKKIDGKWYHFDAKGYMQTGWLKLNDTWYYLKSNGVMATGWQKIGSDYYFFNSDGSMAKNTWKGDYYLTSSGKMARNTWIGKYHVDENGKWDQTAN